MHIFLFLRYKTLSSSIYLWARTHIPLRRWQFFFLLLAPSWNTCSAGSFERIFLQNLFSYFIPKTSLWNGVSNKTIFSDRNLESRLSTFRSSFFPSSPLTKEQQKNQKKKKASRSKNRLFYRAYFYWFSNNRVFSSLLNPNCIRYGRWLWRESSIYSS